MSLINEALKRAEAEKRRNIDPSQTDRHLPPVYEQVRQRRVSRTTRLQIYALLVATGALLFIALEDKDDNGVSPRTALARPASASALPGYPHPRPAKTEVQDKMSAEAQQAFVKTLDAVTYYTPGEVETHRLPRAVAVAPPSTVSDTSGSEPEKLAAAAQPKTSPATQPVATPPPQIDPSKFKVNGIMYGPLESTAIVNGHLIRAGDMIGEATVVGIHPHSVELEVGSRRLHIRM